MRGFLLFLIFLLPAGALADPQVIDQTEASVNSSLILLSDVKKFRQTMPLRSQLDPLFANTPLATKGASVTDAEIVEFLIDEKLITEAYPITDTEVEQEISTIQSNNHIDREQLKQALQERGFTFDDYFELIRVSASKRNLIDRDIRTKVTISDDDIKNYFLTHHGPVEGGARAYHLKLISVTIQNYKSMSAAREVARSALKEIRKGESFEEVAKRVSDDSNASTGGDLGTLPEKSISPIIRSELKRLQVGQISDVFGGRKTGAFLILKLLGVQSDESEEFQSAKENIRGKLAAEEYQRQIQLWLQRQAQQNAFIHRAGEPTVPGLKS